LLTDLGCYERSAPEGVFRPAAKAGCVPEDFYSSTHHRTQVFVNGSWREVSNQRMDGVIVEQGEELICTALVGDETYLEYWEWNVKNVNS
jgi:hypothetical protein